MSEQRFKVDKEFVEYPKLVDTYTNCFYHFVDDVRNVEIFCERLNKLVEENEKLRMEVNEEFRVAYCFRDMVKLKNGEWVVLSDRLRIEGVVIESGDTAIVRSFDNGNKVVVDIKKQHKETVDGVGDLDIQLRQFNRLQGGY